MKPFLLFLGINRFDAHPFASLLNFDFDFLREGFCFLVRTGLCADGRRNLDVAARFAVEADTSELVLDVHRLACAERHCLLEIPGHLVLRRGCAACGLSCGEQQRGEQSCNRCETQRLSLVIWKMANHYGLASKTSSSVCCFSWYMASNW